MDGAEPENPNLPPNMPSFDDLLAAIDKLNLTDEDRESILAGLKDGPPLTQGMEPGIFAGYSLMSYAIILSGVALSSIFAFGLYRLYKSTRDDKVEKEKKRLKRENRRRRRR